LADGALAGAEALLRWRHPSQGLLSPEHFLPALELGRLSARVGAWVIETACGQAALWRVSLRPDFRMGVNLFGSQFRAGNLVEWVQAALTKTGLPPGALEIEITENIILRHEDDMIQPLRQLRELGVGIAFDDYGTGFASLSMLTRYPVSRLKIDRAFTMAICESHADAAVVRYLIGLGATLGIAITAEGIETEAQAALLLRDGCDEGQGYYFGRPMTAADFQAYAAKQSQQGDRKAWTRSASSPAAE
jgi:EAL domain-containing protein (putative c-di-GMP-specific phosphodiesterase class I)